MKRIKITINKDGTQKLEVTGAQGKECLAFTRKLEERLGVLEGERVLKPECLVEHEELTETEQIQEYDK